MAHKNKLPQKPRISPNLESSALLDKPFSDHEEYGSLQLEHDAIHDVDADLVIIENSTFSKIDFKNCTLHKPRITNVIFDGCDFSLRTGDFKNNTWRESLFNRIEFINCHTLGFVLAECHFNNVLFRNCHGKYWSFRFSKLVNCRFEDCNLIEADFQNCDLSGVDFVNCQLRGSDFFDANLNHTDVRGSNIDNLRIGTKEVKGMIVEPHQALQLTHLLGIDIRAASDQ